MSFREFIFRMVFGGVSGLIVGTFMVGLRTLAGCGADHGATDSRDTAPAASVSQPSPSSPAHPEPSTSKPCGPRSEVVWLGQRPLSVQLECRDYDELLDAPRPTP